MTACWWLTEASRIASSALWAPNHSQQELDGAGSAFQICHQQTGGQACSLPKPAAEAPLSQPSLEEEGGRTWPLGTHAVQEQEGGQKWPSKTCLGNEWPEPPGQASQFLSILLTAQMGPSRAPLSVRDAEAGLGLSFLSFHWSKCRLETITSKPTSSSGPADLKTNQPTKQK